MRFVLRFLVLTGLAAVALVSPLTAGAVVANDDFANATAISTVPYSATVDNTGATLEPGEPPACWPPIDNTVWLSPVSYGERDDFVFNEMRGGDLRPCGRGLTTGHLVNALVGELARGSRSPEADRLAIRLRIVDAVAARDLFPLALAAGGARGEMLGRAKVDLMTAVRASVGAGPHSAAGGPRPQLTGATRCAYGEGHPGYG